MIAFWHSLEWHQQLIVGLCLATWGIFPWALLRATDRLHKVLTEIRDRIR